MFNPTTRAKGFLIFFPLVCPSLISISEKAMSEFRNPTRAGRLRQDCLGLQKFRVYALSSQHFSQARAWAVPGAKLPDITALFGPKSPQKATKTGSGRWSSLACSQHWEHAGLDRRRRTRTSPPKDWPIKDITMACSSQWGQIPHI